MIEFYKKHGLIVYWILLLLDVWDNTSSKIEFQGEYGYYLKGLEFLSLILLLTLNFNKRTHTTSKWIIFSSLVTNVIGSYVLLGNFENSTFLGYSFYGVTYTLFFIFMYRLIRKENVSNKEPIILGIFLVIAGIILFVKSKVDFAGFTYFAYIYGLVLCALLSISFKLLSVKNKRTTAINCFIPSSILLYASGVILIVLRISGDNSGINILRLTEILCTGYGVALMANGAKKVLK